MESNKGKGNIKRSCDLGFLRKKNEKKKSIRS